MIFRLTENQTKELLSALPKLKQRIANLRLTLNNPPISNAEIYSVSLVQALSHAPASTHPGDKTGALATKMVSDEERSAQIKKELTLLESILQQVENAMECLTPEQRYVIKERCNKNVKWETIAINAGERFYRYSPDYYQKEFKAALSILSDVLVVDDYAYSFAIGSSEWK